RMPGREPSWGRDRLARPGQAALPAAHARAPRAPTAWPRRRALPTRDRLSPSIPGPGAAAVRALSRETLPGELLRCRGRDDEIPLGLVSLAMGLDIASLAQILVYDPA